MITPFDRMTATEVHEKQWNGEMYDPQYKCYSDTQILREAMEKLVKYAEDRYQQGVRDGLNIEENALAQEVERLRGVMKDAARHIRHGYSKSLPCWYVEAAEALEHGLAIKPDA